METIAIILAYLSPVWFVIIIIGIYASGKYIAEAIRNAPVIEDENMELSGKEYSRLQ